MQVRATPGRGRCRAPPGEHLGEQVAEGDRVIRAARRKVETFEPAAPLVVHIRGEGAGVIARSSVPIDQGLVGAEDLPETHLGRAVAGIDVGVEPTRQVPVGPLDLGLGRAAAHAQNDVKVHA